MSDFAETHLEDVVLGYFGDLGWQSLHGSAIGPGGAAEERSSYAQVILEDRLRLAVSRNNPRLPPDAIDHVVKTVGRAESQVLISENYRVYKLLVEGVPVEYRDVSGRVVHDRAWLIDWDDAEANDFLCVKQFTVVEDERERRPDIVAFVNGLPLAVIELKAAGAAEATVKGAHNQIRTYVKDIPSLFAANAVCVVSDGLHARVGTLTGGWEHYAPWKTIDGEMEPAGVPQIEVLVRGLFARSRFLDLIRNFTVFSDEPRGLVKRVAKYHQYWAVNAAEARTVDASTSGDGRAGVVWHTQGSGKSLEMLFYAGKIMRNPSLDNPTLVLLSDRNDLDDQLFGEVFATARTLPETPLQATSRENLRSLLTRNSGGIIFATLQKFGLSEEERDAGRAFPTLTERRNVVVIADEAHRSQYDFIDGLARNLRDALPNATFIGFTGTPIEASDKNTRQVFGDYIDIYDLTQAVEDGATVKVYYEARLAKVELPAAVLSEIDDTFRDATEGAEEDVKRRLKTRWARVEAIVGSDRRVAELATDIVQHWEQRRRVLKGKALVVAMSRRIAVALYDEIVRLRPEWHSDQDDEGKIKVVITGSAADDQELQPHIRDKKRLRALKQRAKDPNDELELVIVRDMWLTGFDSPSMHTMYIDKPMKGAGLMQAIARVNRTFHDKPSGLVVDYIGIAEDLKEALADYTDCDRQTREVGLSVEAEALPHLIEKHEVLLAILHGHDWRSKATSGEDRIYLEAMAECAEFVLASPGLRERFIKETRHLIAFFTMCVPNPAAMELRGDVAFFQRVAGWLAKDEQTEEHDERSGAELDTAIRQLVNAAVAGGGVIDIYAQAGLDRPDLSLIDDAFVERVQASPHPNLQVELLRRLINDGIRSVARTNIVQDKRFSEMLRSTLLRYNNRSIDAAQVIAELVELANHLKAEAGRGEALNMSSAELAFYDAVRSHDGDVATMDDAVLQSIARELVVTVRKNATIDWSSKESVRAKLRAAVRRVLLNHDYPPDRQQRAIDLVLQQAELIANDWAPAGG